MTDFALARQNMIDCQLRTNRIKDERVLATMSRIPREDFVASSRRSLAYMDVAIPIAPGRAMAPPLVIARMLQLAALGADDLVLYVAAGKGYGACVAGHMASAVVALEGNENLVIDAVANLGQAGGDNVVVSTGPLADGWAKQAPYDVILIEGAVEHVPDALLDQLADDGRLIAAIGERGKPSVLTVMTKTENGIATLPTGDVAMAYLDAFDRAREFVF